MIRKNSADSFPDFLGGETLLIDKDAGWTSFDVVKKVKNIIRVKKVGHAGTLDPFATGLLILCTGKETKKISSFQDLYKVYEGVITLGIRTESFDTETDAVETKPFNHVTPELIEEVRRSFLGEIEQLPPMFSAVKHKGKALYKYARKGIEVERKTRAVKIYSFDIKEINLPDIRFAIKCSKGTYIRTIADDFGRKLGSVAHLSRLRRTAIGGYSVEDAFSIKEFENNFYVRKV